MDIRLIEDFLDLCRTGNFSESAENRFVTQPTLSRRIKQLEDWIGASLIERQLRPVRLTVEGRAFLPIAQEMHYWVTTAQGRLEESLEAAPPEVVTAHVVDPTPDGAPATATGRQESPEESGDAVAFHLVLVDDSEVSLMVLAKLIEDIGHSCTQFGSAENALTAFTTQSWDLAVCDYRMPGIDGAGFADRVRDIEAERKSDPMPIVGVSTSTDLGSITECFRAGMNDYLCKPVGTTEMRVVLDRWLPQSKTLEAAELDALNDNISSGLGDKEIVLSFCTSMRPKVQHISEAIENGRTDALGELLAVIRDEAYMTGAYSFARTCIQLAQSVRSGSMRESLAKRGPFLCEFVRLESALANGYPGQH